MNNVTGNIAAYLIKQCESKDFHIGAWLKSWDRAECLFNETIKTQCADIKKYRGRPYPSIEFKNGSTIQFRSFSRPNNLRGCSLNEIILDEWQDDETTATIINPTLARKSTKLLTMIRN